MRSRYGDTATPRLSLDGIPSTLWSQARMSANAGETRRFFGYADSMLAMHLLTHNWSWFKQRGLHVKALLDAWSSQKVAYPWEDAMRHYLHECDRAELLRLSDPFPDGHIYTLYRGVRGRSNPRGISWTTSLEEAEHFAYGNGTVYTTTVNREDVYARIHESGREEHEMLVPSLSVIEQCSRRRERPLGGPDSEVRPSKP